MFRPFNRAKVVLSIVLAVALWIYWVYGKPQGIVDEIPSADSGGRDYFVLERDFAFGLLLLAVAWIVSAGYVWIAALAWRGAASVGGGGARVLKLTTIVLFVLLPLFAERSYFFNPLPADSVFIAHFQANRAQIEAALQEWRAGKDINRTAWTKAGIEDISEGGGIWLSNPSSIESARLAARINNTLSMRESGRRYGAMEIELLAHSRFYRSARYGLISKTLAHFPVEPTIEKGLLLAPREFYPDQPNGVISWRRRVLNSLDQYPPQFWHMGECLYRPIAPQWFIQMCRTYS